MEYVTLVVIGALFEYVFFTLRTGKARADSGLQAPAVTGDEMFERLFRVQQNTLEQIVVFIPSIFICGMYLSEPAAAAIGVLFIIGRAVYFNAYITNPEQRGPGMIITVLSNTLLLLGGLAGVVLELIQKAG
jgi:glutathione S-transferase